MIFWVPKTLQLQKMPIRRRLLVKRNPVVDNAEADRTVTSQAVQEELYCTVSWCLWILLEKWCKYAGVQLSVWLHRESFFANFKLMQITCSSECQKLYSLQRMSACVTGACSRSPPLHLRWAWQGLDPVPGAASAALTSKTAVTASSDGD